MDYVEAFRNLKSNQKYSRKSPHKAVLLLTVIKLYETNVLTDNEIPYDDSLQDTFKLVWSKVLPGETFFHPEAYLPYWYMQSEDFWHIVPKRGKEDILNLMRDEHVKPSEFKLKDCVKYAELDEDLYFLMTIPSGRSSMKRALLETYTSLSSAKIDRFSESEDNSMDNSVKAMEDFKQLLSSNTGFSDNLTYNSESVNRFNSLSDDVQIALNILYFTFLKNNPYDRTELRGLCSNIYELYDRLTIRPVGLTEISYSFIQTYRNFLMDLKISLMSENGAMSLIDSIENAIQILDGKEPSTTIENSEIENKESPIPDAESIHNEKSNIDDTSFYYNPTHDTLPELKPAMEIRNGKRWTEDELINLQFYFEKGYDFECIATALGRSEVSIKSKLNALGLIEYDYEAERLKKLSEEVSKIEEEKQACEEEEVFNYEPKGKIAKIKDIAQNTYDLLWMIAIVDLETVSNRRSSHSLDELACMMIAHAWELMNKNTKAKEKETDLRECIEYLIEESKEYMDIKLSWESTKDEVFEAIKDYPMAGIFEDTVESLVYEAPFNILRAWYPEETNYEIITNSQNFTKPCLYAFFNKKIDPFITINKGWQGNIFYDHDNLIKYFTIEYNNFIAEI